MSVTLDISRAAAHILKKNPMTLKRLNYICYYSQAWTYVFFNDFLFPEDFIAGPCGPHSSKLREIYGNDYFVDLAPNPNVDTTFPCEHAGVIELVMKIYEDFDIHDFESLSMSERPWWKYRGDLSLLDPGKNIIPQSEIADFFRKTYSEYCGKYWETKKKYT